MFFFCLKVLKRIGQYCAKPDFKPEMVGRVSFAAKSLCMWVRAMEVYGRIYRVVEPKKKVRLALLTADIVLSADEKLKKELGMSLGFKSRV